MRRPIPLRKTGLKAAEFKLIGEIVVLAGMIEDTLKRMPLAMLRIEPVPGISMTAHGNSAALCEMILSIVPYFVSSEELNREVENAMKLVRKAAESRNDIAHGPFYFFGEDDFKGTRKMTARSKLKMSERRYDRTALEDVLNQHIEAWQAVADCYGGMHLLAECREMEGGGPLREDWYERKKGSSPGG